MCILYFWCVCLHLIWHRIYLEKYSPYILLIYCRITPAKHETIFCLIVLIKHDIDFVLVLDTYFCKLYLSQYLLSFFCNPVCFRPWRMQHNRFSFQPVKTLHKWFVKKKSNYVWLKASMLNRNNCSDCERTASWHLSKMWKQHDCPALFLSINTLWSEKETTKYFASISSSFLWLAAPWHLPCTLCESYC